MAWISAEAARIAGSGFLQSLTDDDLVSELRGVVCGGWMAADGAVLLKAWYESYFGERSRFPEIMDYEVAVNGRGIPDLDLDEIGEERVSELLRRGAAFAWAALHEQRRQLPNVEMAAYISVAPTLIDPEYFTGSVTFCAVHPDQPPYIDPVRLKDEIVISLSAEDCAEPLPG